MWINNGELFGPKPVRLLARTNSAQLVSYDHDDATGERDGWRFGFFLASLALYDRCVVVRPENILEYQEHGACHVLWTWMSYDEVTHAPFKDRSAISANFRSDVAFVYAALQARPASLPLFCADLPAQATDLNHPCTSSSSSIRIS